MATTLTKTLISTVFVLPQQGVGKRVKELAMPIDIRKVPSKARKVAVEIVPAEWQDYLLY